MCWHIIHKSNCTVEQSTDTIIPVLQRETSFDVRLHPDDHLNKKPDSTKEML